jgi:hypothetical protein
MAFNEVVEHHDVVPVLQQLIADDAADIPGSPCYQHTHL